MHEPVTMMHRLAYGAFALLPLAVIATSVILSLLGKLPGTSCEKLDDSA
jgi:hypothetical protein